jgi:D-xylose transport system permease protein
MANLQEEAPTPEAEHPGGVDPSTAVAPVAPAADSAAAYLRASLVRIKGGETGVLPVVAGLLLVSVLFQSLNNHFLTAGNLVNLLVQAAVFSLLATGEVFALLLGEIDLSIGFVAGVGAVVMTELVSPSVGWPWWAAIAAALVVCAFIGFLQGSLITRIGLPSFVVTLAGLLFWEGVMLYILGDGGSILIQDNIINDIGSANLTKIGGWVVMLAVVAVFATLTWRRDTRRRDAGLGAAPPSLTVAKILAALVAGVGLVLLCNADRGVLVPVYGMPWVILLVFAIVALWTFVLGRLKFGRYVYAIGGNAEAARRAGINLARIRTTAFMLCSLTAGIAGVVYASRLRSISTSLDGGTLVLYSVAAAVIGGTSLFGGRGKALHGVLGGVVIAAIDNGMGLLGFSAAAKYIVTAVVLLIAVAIDAVARRNRPEGTLASALTTKWEMTRRAELQVSRLEVAVQERAKALEVANRELETLVREATQLAMHDALTGLPNRLLFADRAAQVLAAARRDGGMPVVLMLDLDGFKEVNDTLGHQHGDLLLQQVAQRLSALMRQNETVARFGGDEFTVLLNEGGSPAGAGVAMRIASALEQPFHLGEATVGVEASIGIATAAMLEEPTLEELLRQADIAMYKAKADRSGFAHFAACNDDGTPGRLKLIGELRQGLDREELVLHYQPKIAVLGGELLGVEALVRWQHPSRGLLPPAEFIALAEGSTLIHRLTALVLDMALRFARTCLDQGLRLPIAVNISARSLFDPDFPTIIADRLAQAGVGADLLTIEITEGTVMAYPDLALDILTKLRDMGVQLSVDDYGTGYSTMAYLKNLPVHELKIDRSFITNLTSDHNDAVIVKSAMDLGHNLGLSIVAEGVEDEATLLALRTLGVDIAQGYHLGRPMPENLLQQWITDHHDAAMLLTQEPVPAGDPRLETTGGSAALPIKG